MVRTGSEQCLTGEEASNDIGTPHGLLTVSTLAGILVSTTELAVFPRPVENRKRRPCHSKLLNRGNNRGNKVENGRSPFFGRPLVITYRSNNCPEGDLASAARRRVSPLQPASDALGASCASRSLARDASSVQVPLWA